MPQISLVGTPDFDDHKIDDQAASLNSTYYGFDEWEYEYYFQDQISGGNDTWGEIVDYGSVGASNYSEYTIQGDNVTTEFMEMDTQVGNQTIHWVYSEATDHTSGNVTWFIQTSSNGVQGPSTVAVFSDTGADFWSSDPSGETVYRGHLNVVP